MSLENREKWSLQDWLTELESLQPVKFNLRLENVRKVAESLNVLEPAAKVITVGGTNGKGSTVASLSAIYTAAGYKVGCFTSPHLIRFNERISINNQQIADAAAAAIFLQIYKACSDIRLSYFESSLLCALLYFQQFALDLIILEVGMGGRLDATNIIDSDLTIITSIALDHQQYLGATTLKIGFEKAGIMRAGKVCIFADTKRPVSIDEYAQTIHAKLYSLGDDYTFTKDNNCLTIALGSAAVDSNIFTLPIPRINTNAFAAAVVASQFLYASLPVSVNDLYFSAQNISIIARQQLICHDKMQLVLDVAHNPHAVQALADFIQSLPKVKKVHAIFSGLADKDLSGMLMPLLIFVDHWYPTSLGSRRAASAEEIVAVFEQVLVIGNFTYFSTPQYAFDEVVRNYQAGDLVIVYGSFLLVGAIMENLNNEICYV